MFFRPNSPLPPANRRYRDRDSLPSPRPEHRPAVRRAAPCRCECPVRTGAVRHVERQHQRYADFADLHRQIEIAFQIGRVGDTDDDIWFAADDVVAGDQFVERKSGQTIRAGQVDDTDSVSIAATDAFFLLDRLAGKVADALIEAGQGVEKRCFTRIGIASERDGDGRCFDVGCHEVDLKIFNS